MITKLPKEIGNLTGLWKLALYNNKLKELPKGIENLTNLRELYLSYNELTSTKHIDSLIRLRSLYLDNNYLTEINIGRLTELRELCLSHNRIYTIPSYIGLLRYLTMFRYYNNPVEVIPVINMTRQSKTTQEIYSDKESVHNYHVQECIAKSISNILNGPKIKKHIMISEIANDNILTETG